MVYRARNLQPMRVSGQRFSRVVRSRLPAGTLAAAALWTIALVWPGALIAQNATIWSGTTAQANGTTVNVPFNRAVSRRSNLALTLDNRWANSYGYRPIEVTVSSPKPSTADRLITIRLYGRWWSRQSGTITVEQDFELPLGQTSATTTIACPQYHLAMQVFWWDVWVDGVKDRDLSVDEVAARSTMLAGINPGSGSAVSCLIVGPANRERTLMTPNAAEIEFLALPVASFPQRWIDYTCLDVIALSLDELQLVSRVNPQALEALRRWVQAGGQLWTTNLGSEFEQLQDVSKLLQLHAALAATEDQDEEDTDREHFESVETGWRPIRFLRGNPEGQAVTFMDLNTGQTRVVRDPQVIDRLQNDPNYVTTGRQFESPDEARPRRWPADSSAWFVEQRYGLGAVRAFRGDKDALLAGPTSTMTVTPLGSTTEMLGPNGEVISTTVDPMSADGGMAPMRPPLAMALRSTLRWEARHGMTPDDANFDFAKLLVPGVGLAPVTEFQVLITLFVLVIGPANFWLLKRSRRLHLLVLTVPLAAVLTTAALFAYAAISDGFGTTVRAHSFTTLDQRTGEAACWARLS